MPILKFLKVAAGAGKITSKRTYRDHHGCSYTYQVSSRQALALLKQIVRYMKSYKADRARLALKDYFRVTPRNGRYDAKLLAAKTNFEAKLLAIRV